jgi:protein TonB
LDPVPDEEILEDEEPEFLDMSIADEEAVVAPEPVMETAPPPPPPPPMPEPEEEVGEIWKFVEEMPLFPGCNDLPDQKERKKCSDRELMRFLSNNIKYPAVARENGIEGTAFISFVVEKDGTITDPKILRAPGGGLGEEALRVVELMNKQGLIWTPGQQRKVPVRVMFNLPVKFQLQ